MCTARSRWGWGRSLNLSPSLCPGLIPSLSPHAPLLPHPQVLVATSTLAWGVNFPAHLVVVKGTEYYEGKSRRYVDYPITGEP